MMELLSLSSFTSKIIKEFLYTDVDTVWLVHSKCPASAIKNIHVKVEGGRLGEREMDEELCEYILATRMAKALKTDNMKGW